MKRPEELDDADRRFLRALVKDDGLPPPQFDGMASHTGRAIAAAKLHDMETLIASMPRRERLSFCVGWMLGCILSAVVAQLLR